MDIHKYEISKKTKRIEERMTDREERNKNHLHIFEPGVSNFWHLRVIDTHVLNSHRSLTLQMPISIVCCTY